MGFMTVGAVRYMSVHSRKQPSQGRNQTTTARSTTARTGAYAQATGCHLRGYSSSAARELPEAEPLPQLVPGGDGPADELPRRGASGIACCSLGLACLAADRGDGDRATRLAHDAAAHGPPSHRA
jgi:hypothetical protein